MSLPPDLRDVGIGDILQSYINRFKDDLVKNSRVPVGGEINDFFPLVHKAILSRERAEGIKDEDALLFVEEDPPEKLDTEAVTFYIQSRSPGQYGQGPAGTVTHKEVRHHIRGLVEHPDHPGEKLVTAGKFYDNYIRFNIYAKTNKQARQRLIWFSQLMAQYLWYFSMSGYTVVEQGTGERQRVEIPEYGTVTKYPTSFFVRSEEVHHFGTQELKHVILVTDVQLD